MIKDSSESRRWMNYVLYVAYSISRKGYLFPEELSREGDEYRDLAEGSGRFVILWRRSEKLIIYYVYRGGEIKQTQLTRMDRDAVFYVGEIEGRKITFMLDKHPLRYIGSREIVEKMYELIPLDVNELEVLAKELTYIVGGNRNLDDVARTSSNI